MILNFIRKNFEMIIICLLGLVPLLWFQGSEIILGHDSGLVISPVSHFFDRLFLWTYRFGLGQDQSYALSGFMIHGFEALVSSFGFGLQMTQKIVFIFWFVLPGITMYVFGRYLERKLSLKYIALPASVLFMFNHFLLQGWFIAERTKFSLYAALPLMLLFFLQWIDKKRSTLKTSIFISLLFFFLNGNASFPLFGGIFIVLFIFILYYLNIILKEKRLVSFIGLFTLTGIFSTLLNFYWFLPYFNFVRSTYTQTVAQVGGVAGVLTWVNYISQDSSILNLIRLQGIPEWYQNPDHAYAAIFLTNPVLILIGFAIPIFAFLPLLYLNKFKNKKLVLFFLLIAVVSIIFVAGSHPPFGALYILMVKFIPGFVAFRTPFYKFAPALWFSYSILISISVAYLVSRFGKRQILKNIIVLSFIVGVILYSFPFLNGSFFNYVKNKRTMKTQIPQYIYQFRDWIDLNNTNEKIIALPFSNRGFKVDAFTWHYWGLSPVSSLLTNAPIVNRTNMSDQELDIFDYLDSLMRTNDSGWKNLARSLDSTLFLVRHDFISDSDGSVTYPLSSYLPALKDPDVFLVKKFGEWELYRLKNNRTPNNVTLVELYGGNSKIGVIASLPEFNPNNIVYSADVDEGTKEKFKGITSEKYIVSPCIFCNLEYADFNKDLYRPLITKGSVFYPLKEIKDRKQEQVLVGLDKVKYELYQSLENILAFDKVVIENKERSQIPVILDGYDLKIDAFYTALTSELKKGANHNDYLLEVENVMRIEEEVINDNSEKLTDRAMLSRLSISYSKMRKVKEFVAQKIWRTMDENNKRFLVTVVSPGEYRIYLRPNIEKIQNNISFNIDSDLYQKEVPIANGRWVDLGDVSLIKGDHRLEFNLPSQNMFVGTKSADINSTKTGSCYSSDTLRGEIGQSYKISFDHLRLKGNKKFYFKVTPEDETPNLIDTTEGPIKSQGQWDTFETTYKSLSPLKNNFYFSVCNPPDLNETYESIIQINNINIRKITVPDLVLVQKEKGSSTILLPLQKINPTKYNFEKGKNGLVLLPFSNSNEWQINGDATKFVANGYANSWVVTSKNDGVVEYKSQRLVVVGFAVSGISFLLILSYLIYEKTKKYF